MLNQMKDGVFLQLLDLTKDYKSQVSRDGDKMLWQEELLIDGDA